MEARSRSTLKHALKGVCSLALLAIAARAVDWAQFADLVRSANAWWLAASTGILVIERLLAVWKWNILLEARGSRVPFWSLLRIYLIGTFWGMFLPSSLAIDVVRGYQLSRHISSGTLSASSVLADRILGLFALLLLALLGVAFYGSRFPNPWVPIFIGAVAVVAVAGLAALQIEALSRFLERRFRFFREGRIGVALVSAHRSFLEFRRTRGAVARCFAASVVLQIVRVLAFVALARAYDTGTPVVAFFIFVPVLMVLSMLPISIGGIGVREVTFVGLFAAAGMSRTDAFAISFTNSVLVTLTSMLGGLAYAFPVDPARPAMAAEKTGEGP